MKFRGSLYYGPSPHMNHTTTTLQQPETAPRETADLYWLPSAFCQVIFRSEITSVGLPSLEFGLDIFNHSQAIASGIFAV